MDLAGADEILLRHGVPTCAVDVLTSSMLFLKMFSKSLEWDFIWPELIQDFVSLSVHCLSELMSYFGLCYGKVEGCF